MQASIPSSTLCSASYAFVQSRTPHAGIPFGNSLKSDTDVRLRCVVYNLALWHTYLFHKTRQTPCLIDNIISLSQLQGFVFRGAKLLELVGQAKLK